MKLVLLGIPLLAVFSYCAHGTLHITVINETDHNLRVWAFYEGCDESPGYRQDYFQLGSLGAADSEQYSYAPSPGGIGPTDDVECIQAVDERRLLVLSEPYQSGQTYTVHEAIPLSGEPIPVADELPSQSEFGRAKEEVRENPFSWAIPAVFAAPLLMFPVVIVFIGIKELSRYFRNHGFSRD